MNKNIVQIQNVSFTYPMGESKGDDRVGSRHSIVIHDISLSLAEKSFTILVGKSGCGKSTLLRLIIGVLKPTSGTITKPSQIGMVFQQGALLPWRTVYENVSLGLETLGLPETEKKRRIEEALGLMEIQSLKKEYPRDLSGGQRQRVGIARALVRKPELLILDEPFSALDIETTRTLHEKLLDIWKTTSITILMVSHSIEEAVSLGEKVVVMEKGKITHTVDIELPFPRSNTNGEFKEKVAKVSQDL